MGVILEPDQVDNKEEFYQMVTRFIHFELDHFETPTMTLSKSETMIENLIRFHEKDENYEACAMILNYKKKMRDV